MRSRSRELSALFLSAFPLRGLLRRVFPLLLLIAILPGWSGVTAALPAPPIELEADLGFNGYYVPGYLTPVRVRLKNPGATIAAAKLIISQSAQTLEEQTRTVQVSQDINLPSSLPKGPYQRYELQFPIFSQKESLTSEAQLQLVVQAAGRTLAKKTISLHDYEYAYDRLNLLLSEAPAPAKLPNGQPLLPIDLQQLPNHWSGYQGVERVYLGRFNLGNLSSAQQQALLSWLSSGGALVVLLGANWYFQRDQAWDELVPFTPRDIEVAQLDGISRQITVGQTRGTILASTDSGLPLFIRGRFGRGYVDAVTVDFLALSSGPQEEALWRALNSTLDDPVPTSDLGAELLDNLKLEQPSRPILAGLLAIYLLGFALLGMMALHRRRLLGAIPLWVGLISLGLFYYLQQPAFTRPLRAIEAGRIWVRGDQAFAQDWYSAFARRGADLKLQFDSQVVVNQAKLTHDLTLNLTPSQAQVQLALAAQEMEYLQLAEPMRFPVEFTVRGAGSQITIPRVDVYNETDQELTGALLWWQDQFYGVGTVGAHEHVVRTLTTPLGSRRPSGTADHSEIETSIQQRLLAEFEHERPAETVLLAWVRQARFAPLSDEYRTVLQLVTVIGR